MARARQATLRRPYPAPNAGVVSDAIGVPRSGSRRAPQRALRPVGLRPTRCPGNPGPGTSPSSESGTPGGHTPGEGNACPSDLSWRLRHGTKGRVVRRLRVGVVTLATRPDHLAG